ncbi:ribokinase [Eubacteriales bacterium OttesenSCG-928-A19]|nr:ribokinase [Eubacteriales bacterium OttesenSCG-928-A19]
MKRSVVIIGSINMDKVYQVPHIPLAGETILSGSQMKNPGGKGANQAVAAALQGAKVHMIGCVGADDDGEALLRSLGNAGVYTDGVLRLEDTPTGIAMIVVADDGENTIVVSAGANARVDAGTLDQNDVLLREAGFGVVQLEIPHETAWLALRRLRAHGVATILNPSPACAIPDEALRNTDILVPNETEMRYLLGHDPDPAGEDLMAYARTKGLKAIVMTLGPEGCCLATPDAVRPFPCTPVRALDSTGAGDCFLGTMTAWLAGGHPLETAIEKAMAAAAIAVTRPGAQQAMPRREEIA